MTESEIKPEYERKSDKNLTIIIDKLQKMVFNTELMDISKLDLPLTEEIKTKNLNKLHES